jgi:restriction system protein
VTALIEANVPDRWEDLERQAARILEECGYEVSVQHTVPLARGSVKVDVYAIEHTSPPNVLVLECKNWRMAAPKTVVHAFRTVVTDSGANIGFVISGAGFQEGAIEAARYTNIRLVTWEEFQTVFVERWYQQYMAPRLREEADPLIEYTEPINSRIFRKADELPKDRRERFKTLREKHFVLGMGLIPLFLASLGKTEGPVIPELPLRATTLSDFEDALPAGVLDAPALRLLLTALTDSYRAAIAEFDDVFGERA